MNASYKKMSKCVPKWYVVEQNNVYSQVGLCRSLASQGTVRWLVLTPVGLSWRGRPSIDVDFCSLDVFVNGTENNPKLNG